MRELPQNNLGAEELEVNSVRENPEKIESVSEGGTEQQEVMSQLGKVEGTAKEIENLLSGEKISDAKKETVGRKLANIVNIGATAVGLGTAITINWGGAVISAMEKFGLGGKTVMDLMALTSKPEVPEVALAGAVVGLLGVLRMAWKQSI